MIALAETLGRVQKMQHAIAEPKYASAYYHELLMALCGTIIGLQPLGLTGRRRTD